MSNVQEKRKAINLTNQAQNNIKEYIPDSLTDIEYKIFVGRFLENRNYSELARHMKINKNSIILQYKNMMRKVRAANESIL